MSMQAPKCRYLVLLVFLMFLAVLLPSNVLAIALGKVQVSSHLGEPFYAEIPFTLTQSEAIAKLSIELATPDEYRMLEVYRPAVLNELTADIKTHSAGDNRMQLSSTAIIRSPYLNIILKVKYGRATHFKKFPIVLDMPTDGMTDEALPTTETSAIPNVTSMPIAPIIQAPIVTAVRPFSPTKYANNITNPCAAESDNTSISALPTSAQTTQDTSSKLELSELLDSSNTSAIQAVKSTSMASPASRDIGISLLDSLPSQPSAQATQTISKKVVVANKAAAQQRGGTLTAGRYGPVKAGDSIISIARRMNIASRYSLQQIMSSIYRANPASFEKNNMNLLMKGTYLELPTAATIGRISKTQGIRLVAKHDKSFAALSGKRYVSKVRVAQTNARRGTDGTAAPYAIAVNPQLATTRRNNQNGNGNYSAMAGSGDIYSQAANAPMMQALRQQNAVLQQQLAQTQKQLAAVNPALENKNAELQQLRQELSEKEAEIADLRDQAGFMGGIMDTIGTWGLVIVGGLFGLILLAVLAIFGMRFMRNRKAAKPIESYDEHNDASDDNKNNSNTSPSMEAEALESSVSSLEESTVESSASELAGADFADNFSDTMAKTIGPNDGFTSPAAEESGTAASEADAEDFMDNDVNAFFEGSGSDIGGDLGSTLEGGGDLEATGMLDSASIPELTDQDTSEMTAFEEDIEDEPDPDVNYLAEADVYLRYGMEDEAAHHVKMALKQEPTNAEAHIKLLQILSSMNDEPGIKSALSSATSQLRGAQLERYKSEVAELDSKAGSKSLTDTLEDTIRTHAEQMLKGGNELKEDAKQSQEAESQEDDFSITTQAGEAVLPVEENEIENNLDFSPAEEPASADATTAAVEDELDFDNFSFGDDTAPEEDAAAGQNTQAETESVLADAGDDDGMDDLDFDLGGMSFDDVASSEDTIDSNSSNSSPDDSHDLGDDDLDFDLGGMEITGDDSDDSSDNNSTDESDESDDENMEFSLSDDDDSLDFDISSLGLDDTTDDNNSLATSTATDDNDANDANDASDDSDFSDLGDMEFDLSSLGLDDDTDNNDNNDSSDSSESFDVSDDGDMDFDLNFDDPGDDHPKAEAARGAELSSGNEANEANKVKSDKQIDAPEYITSTMPQESEIESDDSMDFSGTDSIDDEFESLFVADETTEKESFFDDGDIDTDTDVSMEGEQSKGEDDILEFGDDDFSLPVFDESDEENEYDDSNIVSLSDHLNDTRTDDKFAGESTIINFPQTSYTDTDSLLATEGLLLDEDSNDDIANHDATSTIDIDVMESSDFDGLLDVLDEYTENDDNLEYSNDSVAADDVNITQEIDTLLTDLGVNDDVPVSIVATENEVDSDHEHSFEALSMEGNSDVDSLLRELDVGTHGIANEDSSDENAATDVLDHMQHLMTHKDLNLTGLNLDRARSLLASGRLEDAQKAFECVMPDAECQALLGQAAIALQRHDRGTAGSHLHQASSMLDEDSQDWYEQLQFQYRGL
ncbi:MAG: FimV/HubP family polar landmark protein [Mariprofundales bacterium]